MLVVLQNIIQKRRGTINLCKKTNKEIEAEYESAFLQTKEIALIYRISCSFHAYMFFKYYLGQSRPVAIALLS